MRAPAAAVAVTAIVGAFGARAGAVTPEWMLAAMPQRGAEDVAVWQARGDVRAGIGTARHGWESGSASALLRSATGVTVAADAALYYREDLARALHAAGVHPAGDSPAELILAAYQAWGEHCAARLEGDFAFVLWDGNTRRVLCACDHGGKRPLFYADAGGTLCVASAIGALLAHPACPADLDLAVLACESAGLFAASGAATCYRAVARLPPGCTLIRRFGDRGGTRLDAHWTPPPARESSRLSFDDAAAELRALLRKATAERLAPVGASSVWLSGGWDSTAVLGAAGDALGRPAAAERIRAVSLSYPVGDPGREDELIARAADRWDVPVHWIDIDAVPMLDDPGRRAAARDEPFAHAFEASNRSLAEGSRACAARIAFDGAGGDQLFQGSELFFADLLRRGQWRELAREWQAKGLAGRGGRVFFKWAVQPLLPDVALRAATALRGGRPLYSPFDRTLPPWIQPEFARRHELQAREHAAAPARRGRGAAEYETHWYLTHPYFPRVMGTVAELALAAGTELRSPLYDRRVIEFAVTRPRTDRSAGRETKRLLRRAMRGLLPESLLAPRPRRTGVTSAYFARGLRIRHAEAIAGLLTQPLALEEVGIVDGAALRRAWASYVRSGGGALGVTLLLTLQCELWLRARVRPPAAAI